ncbi:hypothetical protein EGY07_18995 [Chryseobacterium indologenes]|uniref:hypothetical protein n=1 Tax=Chryseobacterium indologenes TaxID=253 RepID=UPI000F502AB7|nr:hypothetical protein [Chryseobacterium indologenes]AYZ37474.1 hypothetical protein EGY07_18995 [Chryseobacterium indologenes]MBF6646346.1 hypothetical protein [Chryseobacterium indologenes]MBU3050519.1 hypothetical protein [Chryseobacterium indologenes]MEB4761708.1 hypothetical protein [Chryseobacterium indologenes]QQQ69982.1 hypothetical protein JHW31_15905 [Chryseobacterium indologenes]
MELIPLSTLPVKAPTPTIPKKLETLKIAEIPAVAIAVMEAEVNALKKPLTFQSNLMSRY